MILEVSTKERAFKEDNRILPLGVEARNNSN